MSDIDLLHQTAPQRYDHALRRTRNYRLPPGASRPAPTSQWPAENIALLERFREWLLSGGTSPHTVSMLYIPTAGYVLGLALKPHPRLDLHADLDRALDYVRAKRLSTEWIDMSLKALDKFRTFLRRERGEVDLHLPTDISERYLADLPDWLVSVMRAYFRQRQAHWRSTTRSPYTLWSPITRMWRWLFSTFAVRVPADLKRQHILAYIDQRLAAGIAASTINLDLRTFQALLRLLEEHEYRIAPALLRLPGLKQPDRLPRYLTDAQVHALACDLEQCVQQTVASYHHRDALLDRAAFYLLWHAGLRLGEVEALRLDNLDLDRRRIMIRCGKGLRDRTVYLTETALTALRCYLAVRGLGATDHVFLYRNAPLTRDRIHAHLRAAGDRVGVRVSAHRLRHTFATQLLNAGCRITSIQKLLGHQRLNSTQVYARAYEQTVEVDYFTAMAIIEQRVVVTADSVPGIPGSAPNQAQALDLLQQLEASQLSLARRLELVGQLRRSLATLAE